MANNINELRNQILKEMQKATTVTAAKAEADMYHYTEDFYVGTDPKYKRTGALGDTPRVTATKKSGNQVSFEAYLDENHVYSTGKHPTMSEVLAVANDHGNNPGHLNPPVGKQGFWDRAERQIEKDFDDTMGQFFEKI